MNDSLTDRLLDELRAAAAKRRRLLAAECDDALVEVAPQLQSDPGRRRRLLDLLTVMRDSGCVEWSVGRDRSVQPPLPSFVTLAVRGSDEPTTTPVPTVPWRPELEWAYALRLTQSEHQLLAVVNAYRRDRDPETEVIPHRERSLLLFGDEKRIDRLVRSRLCEPGRLTLDLLDSYWAAPPIAWQAVGDAGDCIVSENAAGFHTLCRAFAGKVHLVAYGAGGAFAQSIAGLAGATTGRLLYIGDLDAEGIAIPQRAAITAERFEVPPPEPHIAMWSLLVALATENGQAATPVPGEVATELCEWFPAALAKDVQRLLEAGVRVPQEALTLERLGASE